MNITSHPYIRHRRRRVEEDMLAEVLDYIDTHQRYYEGMQMRVQAMTLKLLHQDIIEKFKEKDNERRKIES